MQIDNFLLVLEHASLCMSIDVHDEVKFVFERLLRVRRDQLIERINHFFFARLMTCFPPLVFLCVSIGSCVAIFGWRFKGLLLLFLLFNRSFVLIGFRTR